jgi:uncharacterized protein (TIGR02687 family)
MDTQQLNQGLMHAFFTENHRIVFWYDAEQSFIDELSQIDLPGVKILNMQGESTFGLKLKLELGDTENKYLLYFPESEPEANDDWLLDIKLYSRSFYADRMSLIFNDLGLQQQSLREHLAKRERFLSSKARTNSLKRLIQPADHAEALDLAMIAVALGANARDISTLIYTLADMAVSDELGLESNPPVIEDLYKYGLMPPLLQALRDEVGYPASLEEINGEKPFSFGHFLIRLLTTGFCESVGEVPAWASSAVMPSANARATCRSLLSRWRDSSRHYKSYDVVSGWVSEALRVQEKIRDIPVETLANVATFEVVERQIIVDLTKAIPESAPRDLAQFTRIISDRLDNYWASRHKDDDIRRKYRRLYSALSAAIDLFTLRHSHTDGFHFASTEALYKAYEHDLYRFDSSYRHYFAASRLANVELLKKLDDAVELCYSSWYLDQLGRCWSDRIESERRLDEWKLGGIPNQQDFYEHFVRPQRESHRNKRVVVIISDAFRYEAAVELCERINQKRYSEATLASQLGVLPSYTTLGMASLLPHKTLEYRADGGDNVFADNQSTAGTQYRNTVLAQHHGMAVTADQIKEWSREEGRDALKDQLLVYVYHNVIDDRSDSGGPSESDTFQHVEYAIEELNELTRKILMHFNTSTVLITADHGFLFQQSKMEEADRTSLVEKPENSIKSKKRYVIGHSLPPAKDVWRGSTKQTAGTTSDTQFWIPKGANRFHFVGGARFVHGGAMPQEIVVPVITVNQLRGEKAEKRTKRKVAVISPKSSLKMVTSIQRFDLIQTESVSELVIPVTVAVAIFEGQKAVSSEEVVTFDCSTDSMAERMKQVRLSLIGSDFDRQKDYFLIIRDKDMNTELERYRVTIDLAFTDDFF